MSTIKVILCLVFVNLFHGFNSCAKAQKSVYLNQYKTPKNSLPVTGYYQIGGYRVKGNPYFKVDFILGDIYSVSETAKNIYLRYDVYHQKLEFISTSNPDDILVKEPTELDSFLLYKKEKDNIIVDIKFVYATIIGAPGNFYYSCLHKGDKYSVYKRYTAILVTPSERTGEAESREFEIQTEYWYVTETTKEFKKVNGTAAALKKEFKEIKDLSEVVKAGSMFKKADEAMIRVFTYLNE